MLGYKFTRQKPIDNYIADFFCHRLNLIIEIDGSTHAGNEKKDKFRQKKLEGLGYNFIRIYDNAVKADIKGVLYLIKEWIHKA
jgi:very-short-patch-repair endonuclease